MRWKGLVISFGVGFLFAIGLGLSGLTMPSKIIAFLNLRNWDPTLLLVMGSAVPVYGLLTRLVRRRKTPVLETKWHVSQKTKIDFPLVFGSVLFGMGWGLSGYCPGPALISLVTLRGQSFAFLISMVVGMWITQLMNTKWSKK